MRRHGIVDRRLYQNLNMLMRWTPSPQFEERRDCRGLYKVTFFVKRRVGMSYNDFVIQWMTAFRRADVINYLHCMGGVRYELSENLQRYQCGHNWFADAVRRIDQYRDYDGIAEFWFRFYEDYVACQRDTLFWSLVYPTECRLYEESCTTTVHGVE